MFGYSKRGPDQLLQSLPPSLTPPLLISTRPLLSLQFLELCLLLSREDGENLVRGALLHSLHLLTVPLSNDPELILLCLSQIERGERNTHQPSRAAGTTGSPWTAATTIERRLRSGRTRRQRRNQNRAANRLNNLCSNHMKASNTVAPLKGVPYESLPM